MPSSDFSTFPLRLNVHKMFQTHHGGLLNVSCAFILRPLSKGFLLEGEERTEVRTPFWDFYLLMKKLLINNARALHSSMTEKT